MPCPLGFWAPSACYGFLLFYKNTLANLNNNSHVITPPPQSLTSFFVARVSEIEDLQTYQIDLKDKEENQCDSQV